MSRAEDDAIAAELAALPLPPPAPRPARKPNPSAPRPTMADLTALTNTTDLLDRIAAALTALTNTTDLLDRIASDWVKCPPLTKRQIREQAATNRALLRVK